MVRRTLKILWHLHLLQDVESGSNIFGTLCIEGLRYCRGVKKNWTQHSFSRNTLGGSEY